MSTAAAARRVLVIAGMLQLIIHHISPFTSEQVWEMAAEQGAQLRKSSRGLRPGPALDFLLTFVFTDVSFPRLDTALRWLLGVPTR